MPTKVELPPPFNRDLRRLARKYPSVLDEVDVLITDLEEDERPGDKIPNVGYDVYKVRLRNPSAQRGKSGGFRVIYYVYVVDQVILLTVYSKSLKTDVSPEQIRQIIEEVLSSRTPPAE